ncbi:hypothetical protein [Lysobacter sp. CA196]|uniref:hypothetical protein n=1 Tax=Lysobacter sp. CA196 TaxID=3455606 RepID=UPI003F8D22F0
MTKSALSDAVLHALAGFGTSSATLAEIMDVLDYPGAARAEVSSCLTKLWDSGAVVSRLDSGKVNYCVAAPDAAGSASCEPITAPPIEVVRAPALKAATLAGEVRRVLASGERLTAARVRERVQVKASATRVSAALLQLFGSGEAEREADATGRWAYWRTAPAAPIEVVRAMPAAESRPEQTAAVDRLLPPPPPVPLAAATAVIADPLGLAARFDAVIDDVEALVTDAFDAGFPATVLKHLTAAAFDLARAHRRLPSEGTRPA